MRWDFTASDPPGDDEDDVPTAPAHHARGDANRGPVERTEPTPVTEPPPAPEPEPDALIEPAAPVGTARPTPVVSETPATVPDPAVPADAEDDTGPGHRWFLCRDPSEAVVHIGGTPSPGFVKWASDAALWTFVVPSTGEAWGFTYYSDTWTSGPSGFGLPPFGRRVEPSSKRWHSVVGVRCRAPGPDTDNPRHRSVAILFLNEAGEPLVVQPMSLDAGSARWVREATARICGTAIELPGEPDWDASWQVFRSDVVPASV